MTEYQDYTINVSAQTQQLTMNLTAPAHAINVANPTSTTVAVKLWGESTPSSTPKLSFGVSPYTGMVVPTGRWIYGEITVSGQDSSNETVLVQPLAEVLMASSYSLNPAPAGNVPDPLPVTTSDGTTLNVGGSVQVSAGQVDANITNGSLKIQAADGVTIPVSGSLDAHISNAALDIQAADGVTLPISGSVSIEAGQLVQVENASGGSLTVAGQMNITGSDTTLEVEGGVTTDIGGGFQRLGGGGIVYPAAGILTVTFTDKATGDAKPAQQLYLDNNGNYAVSVWGDEDSAATTTPTGALVVNPGDALGIAWHTGHLYLSASGNAEMQIQAWG